MSDGTTRYTSHDIPDFMGMYVMIVNGPGYGAYVEMMADANCREAWTIDEADLVLFIGGSDVSPQLYGEDKLPCTSTDYERDIQEKWIFDQALRKGLPMFGICRGSQFLHVMNGGKLWQDVDNHAIQGQHAVIDIDTDELVYVTSTHHQMVRENSEMEIIGVSANNLSSYYHSAADGLVKADITKPMLEIEAYAYNNTMCLGIQGHPEFHGCPEFRSWALHTLQRKMKEWTELEMETA